jgi:hypothetical protein
MTGLVHKRQREFLLESILLADRWLAPRPVVGHDRAAVADPADDPAKPARRRPDVPGLLIDDLAAQLDRFKLLPGGSQADAERVLSGLTPRSPREREAADELADRTILAHPDRFEDAHHLTVKALEVFDRHGWRHPRLPRWLGPARAVAEYPVELVAKTIVKAHARNVSNQMRRLYERREAQCGFDDPQRRPLARARIAMTRLAPDFAGSGGGLPKFLVGGAVISGLASAAKQLGDLSGGGAIAFVALGAVAFVLFAASSWIIVQGAAVAHRRSTLIMRSPLEALWQTIGACGNPPEDDSLTFATIGIVLTAIAWFVTPIVVAAVFYFAR